MYSLEFNTSMRVTSEEASRPEQCTELMLPICDSALLFAVSSGPKEKLRMTIEHGQQFVGNFGGNRNSHVRACLLPCCGDTVDFLL